MNDIGFDLETVYDQEIAPLVTEIIAICQRVDMPMIASFAYATGRTCTSAIVESERTPESFVTAQKEVMGPVETFWMVSRLQENGQ